LLPVKENYTRHLCYRVLRTLYHYSERVRSTPYSEYTVWQQYHVPVVLGVPGTGTGSSTVSIFYRIHTKTIMVVKVDNERSSSRQDKASLNDHIFEQIQVNLQSLRDMNDVTTEDLLRMYHDQISRMVITEKVHSALISDPFQHLKENIPDEIMSNIVDCIHVVSHHSVTTMDGYVRTEAIVRLSSKHHDVATNKKRPRKGVNCLCEFIELQFTYLRTSMLVDTSTISYNIDMIRSSSNKPPIPLLWINIYAANNVPSSVAINMCDNSSDDNEWSDIDSDSTDRNSNDSLHRKQALSGDVNGDIETDTLHKVNINCLGSTREITSSNVDRYEAGMDLCVMKQVVQFLQQPCISSSVDINTEFDDATMFFFLMTFPFYEHEWDIVGYLLKAMFDGDVE
jgi:hypothetical protein